MYIINLKSMVIKPYSCPVDFGEECTNCLACVVDYLEYHRMYD